MEFTQEHEGIRRGVKKFIDAEINPYVDAWEEAGIFPAHELFKKMGDQGYLGINKPVKYGGMGLDYSYQLVFLETLGHIRCRRRADGDRRADRHGDAGARPLRLGGAVQRVPRALHQGRLRRLPRRIRGRRRLRRRLHQDHGAQGRRRLRHRRRQDVDHQRHAGRLDVPARQHRRRPRAQEQVADLPADEDQGRAASPASSTRWACAPPTPRRSSSRTCACRSAIASARRARASPTRCSSSRRSGSMRPRPASSPRSA